MKKVLVLLAAIFILTACGNREITYEKQLRNVNDVEEILEARLEMENPSMDLTVTITQDSD